MNRLLTIGCICAVAAAVAGASPQSWRLAMQAYTFNRLTFYDTVAQTKSVDVNYIEAFYGQTVSADCNVPFGDMNPAQRQMVKRMLNERGVKIVNYYAREDVPNSEAEYRKLFQFAKDLGVEVIVTEPPAEAVPMIDKLCQEYRIVLAIHNHLKGQSRYGDPNAVLAVCKGRSRWVGACADTGHWMRSGIDPLAAIKKLGVAGAIRAIHLKDLNAFGDPNAHDVVWGTGVGKTREILAQLEPLGYNGAVSIEYERDGENNLADIRGCVAFFRKSVTEMSADQN